jgi:hypothetical protein
MNEELYFKDAFTEVDGSINLEVNNLKANCITSNSNNFNLDSEGNLIVNSITTSSSNNSNIDFDMIYPVGSIYFSVNDVNPGTLFGGVWEQIAQGRTLIGVGSDIKSNNTNWAGSLNNNNYSFWCGEMGGQFRHQLTIDEMPAHTHNITVLNENSNGYSPYNSNSEANCVLNYANTFNLTAKGWSNRAASINKGGDKLHNIMPPYLAVYIWKRIS